MFLAIFEQEDKDVVDYVYLDKNDNLIGFGLDKDGIKSVNKELIIEAIDAIRFNNNCVELLENVEGYSVYYNPKTKYKHYFKDGKEDFLMFLKNNGEDALVYKQKDNIVGKRLKHSDHSPSTYFRVFVGSIAGCLLVQFGGYQTAKLIYDTASIVDYNYYKYVAEEVNVFNEEGKIAYYDPIEDVKLDGSGITVEEAIELINNSLYLSDDDKVFLANEELLSDILPYYIGTSKAEKIKMCLNNLSISYYNREKEYPTASGFYNELKPSVINVSDEYAEDNEGKLDKDIYKIQDDRKGIIAHEFIHLLQNSKKSYRYLTESTAELMAKEYFDYRGYNSYENGVINLKLLIDIIGPEPILKGVFGNDYSDFKNILANNLELEDYKDFIDYLRYKPYDAVEYEPQIRRIICQLYKNIYDQDIREDQNILYSLLYENQCDSFGEYERKYYLNKSRMQDKDVFSINVSELMETMPENEFLRKGDLYRVARTNISYDEYLAYYKDTEREKCLKYYVLSDHIEKVDADCYNFYSLLQIDPETGKVIEKVGEPYVLSFEEAFKRGEIAAGEEYLTISDELPEGNMWVYDDNGEIMTQQAYISKNDGEFFGYQDVKLEAEGVKERFSVDTNVNASTLLADVTATNVSTTSESVKATR